MPHSSVVSFPVSDVSPSEVVLPTVEYKESVSDLLNISENRRRQPWRTKDDYTKVPESKIEAVSSGVERLVKKRQGDQGNMFVVACNTAFSKHFPLRISPDMIWLLITQGIANHIKLNPSDGPSHLDPNEKTLIKVRRDDFIKGGNNDWADSINEFSIAIKALAGQEFYDQIVQQFTTTSQKESVAFEVTLMDAASVYFDYGMTTMCGIPRIELEGTSEDWAQIILAAKQMKQYGLDWWWNELEPILKQFHLASRGNAKTEFWQSFYKINDNSGGPYITGHIVKMFPYVLSKNELVKNTFSSEFLTYDDFPSGRSKADFKWEYYTEEFDMQFVTGFFGMAQDPETSVIRPEIGWAVVELVESEIKPTPKTSCAPKTEVCSENTPEDKPHSVKMAEVIEASKANAGIFYALDASRALTLQNEFRSYPVEKREAILTEWLSVYDWSIAQAKKEREEGLWVPSATRPSFKRA